MNARMLATPRVLRALGFRKVRVIRDAQVLGGEPADGGTMSISFRVRDETVEWYWRNRRLTRRR